MEKKESKCTPKELAALVTEVLMKRPNKGVIFPSFLAGVRDRDKFIENLIRYTDGQGIFFYERLQKTCQERIDGLIEKEIEKEEEIIKFSTQRLEELKKRKKGE